MLEEFLPLVSKPARYIDHEVNAVHKDLSHIATKVCLFFPDTYEVGMSHLGLRILYHILNSRPDTVCERVFSPWTDYEGRLRESRRPLSSLESNLPLAEFDILGITLQYELSYTNVLNGLDLAGIPLRAKDRDDGHPVVVAGGPCAVNPEPLSAFIDVFFIGEAEEAIHEIVDLRQRHSGRKEYLEALSRLDGFYVPLLGRKTVRRRIIKDLERAPYPDKPLVPLMKPIHDRVTVEVARGCFRGCRFCQAGVIYRPYRERSAVRVKELLSESLQCTGYDELSLASLSSGDYSGIEQLVVELMDSYRDRRVSVSLPSLRVGTLTPQMIEAIAATRKTGFTLAPEAGTERLRRVINKPVTDADLLAAAETIFRNGWSVLKLYFMIGLPTETTEDLDGIVRLAQDLLSLGKRVSKRRLQINVSVSTFVPKPHTPFQWFGQATPEEIRMKQAYLQRGLRRKGISFKPHGLATSLLEAAFARGDAAVGPVIEEAMRLGCRFDGWTECFDSAKWEQAFRTCGLDAGAYASRVIGPDDPLPWDFVHTGVTGSFLRKEYERAVSAEITDNCRVQCEHCGLGCRDGGTASLGVPAAPQESAAPDREKDLLGRTSLAGGDGIAARIRMRFTKTGRLRFLSHLDVMTVFQRAAARARVPVLYSQGFNPHPRISFGPAISVGMESDAEYFDMETTAFVDLLDVTKALNSALPPGMRIREARTVPPKAPSLSGSIGKYVYEVIVPVRHAGNLEGRVQDFLCRTSVRIEKEGRQREIRPGIEAIRVLPEGGSPAVEVSLIDQGDIKPRVQDVLAELFAVDAEALYNFRIKRTSMYCRHNGSWIAPLDIS